MHERLLQFIWANLYFHQENLHTTDQRPLAILNPGEANDGDGADFREASIRLDGLTFHGDIELHLEARHWYDHRHHEDPRYDRVILHVLLSEDDFIEARRTDNTTIPSLILKPYISERVTSLFRKSRRHARLPCAGFIGQIDPSVIQKQWDTAGSLYFNYKILELEKRYKPSASPFRAWQDLLTASLFDGLGISGNRRPMQRLFDLLSGDIPDPSSHSLDDLLTTAFGYAGLEADENPGKLARRDWSFSNMRPHNQPGKRIPQAVSIWHALRKMSADSLFNDPLAVSWQCLIAPHGLSAPLGEERSGILRTTVYLPAMYILGSLFQKPGLKQQALKAWNEAAIQVPRSIRSVFHRAGLEDDRLLSKPAAVYQYKHLCRENRCEECAVMKMILRA